MPKKNITCGHDYSFVDIFKILFTFRWRLLLMIFGGVLLTFCLVYKFMPERYSSSAVIKLSIANSKYLERNFIQQSVNQLAVFCSSELRAKPIINYSNNSVKLIWYGRTLAEVERNRQVDLVHFQENFLDESSNPNALFLSLLSIRLKSLEKSIDKLERVVRDSSKHSSRMSRKLEALYLTYARLNEKVLLVQASKDYWVRSVAVSLIPISDKPIYQYRALILVFGFFASVLFAVVIVLLWHLTFNKKAKAFL